MSRAEVLHHARTFSKVLSDAHHVLVGTRVALFADLLVDLGRIVAPIADEALEYVAFVGGQGAHLAHTRLPPGSGFESRVLLDRMPMDTEGSGDGGLVHSLLYQGSNGLEEVSRLGSGTLAGGLAVQPEALVSCWW
ncbi:MAG: hypothetical protein JOZ45_12435 [Acidobacteriaceae bacterium]|nr:hypothetical protein [Acidobacteriaceae bacterium]